MIFLRVYNQYSDEVREYNLSHGTDIFREYKNPDTTQARREEIVDFLFNLVRSKNEVPHVLWDDTIVAKNLMELSEVRAEDVYRDGEYFFNVSGLSTLYHFFPELDYVKKGRAPSIHDMMMNDVLLRKVLHKALLLSEDEIGMYRAFILYGAGNCSNFRPATAKTLYEIYGPREGCRVFDSSAGYGGRLTGAHFAVNVSEYLGIDPNTAKSCARLIEYLDTCWDTNTKKRVLEMGSEDFTAENFPEYQNYFDLYFTSPPYWNTEEYSQAETQSFKKFPTYAGWVKGFYQETIHNACSAVRPDGIVGINIFEKIPNIRDITKVCFADNGFYIFRIDKYLMRTLPRKSYDEIGNKISVNSVIKGNFEPIFMAKHYSRLYHEGVIDLQTALRFRERAHRENKKDVDL